MSYATVEQYEARFGPVADTTMLQACLDDCTAAIDLRLDRAGIDHSDPDESFAYRLMSVCRSMANRLMPTGAGDVPVGVTQASMTAGPCLFSTSDAADDHPCENFGGARIIKNKQLHHFENAERALSHTNPLYELLTIRHA